MVAPRRRAASSVGRTAVDALNYIDGRHVPAAEWLENFEPATGTAYGRVASSDAADVERAVVAAARAFPAWSATPAAQRSRVLRALARLIERDKERLARAETVDTGKPVRRLLLGRKWPVYEMNAAETLIFFQADEHEIDCYRF